MPRIAISYRRADSDAITGRIFDRLASRYGRQSVFQDIDNIPLGVDFRTHVNKVIGDCDVVLAIVGRRWVGRRGGQSRIHDAVDPVRLEIEAALAGNIPIVPLLVDRATMPKPEQLPETIRDFVYRNGLPVDAGQGFDASIERLTRSLDQIFLPQPDLQQSDVGSLRPLTGLDILTETLRNAPALDPEALRNLAGQGLKRQGSAANAKLAIVTPPAAQADAAAAAPEGAARPLVPVATRLVAGATIGCLASVVIMVATIIYELWVRGGIRGNYSGMAIFVGYGAVLGIIYGFFQKILEHHIIGHLIVYIIFMNIIASLTIWGISAVLDDYPAFLGWLILLAICAVWTVMTATTFQLALRRRFGNPRGNAG
jgi:hypothetical protein